MTDSATRRFRAIFISDVHLGTRGCQTDKLLDFLRYHEAETVYLVGDIVDGWALQSSWYWPQAHNDVVQKLLRQARKGTRVIYIPGNHDEFMRGYYGTHFGGIEVVENIVHTGIDGRRYLVVHGDIFDLVVTQARWLALLGTKPTSWHSPPTASSMRFGECSARHIGRCQNGPNSRSRTQSTISEPSRRLWRRKPGTTKLKALSAVTFIRRRCTTTMVCAISTAAIGSRAARPWSKATTANSRSSSGLKPEVSRR